MEILPLELVVLDHYARQRRSLVHNLPAVLGRGEKDDVRLTDPWISHAHCELFRQGDVLIVRDLDSKNGVFLRGTRVRETQVMPGDCLTLGRTEVTVRYRRVPTMPETVHEDDSAVGKKVAGSQIAAVPGTCRQPVNGSPSTEELLY